MQFAQKDKDTLMVYGETEIINSNIRTMLTDKAAELAKSMPIGDIRLSCEINDIEIHNAGKEIFR